MYNANGRSIQNKIRMALHPDIYKPMNPGADGEDELLGFTHLDHCIDSIRQNMMCSADITPLVFQWSSEAKEVKIRADIPHTCRDFDLLREWALERKVPAYDKTIKVERV